MKQYLKILSELSHGQCINIRLIGKVEQIFAYKSDNYDRKTIEELIPVMKVNPHTIAYDIRLQTNDGKINLRVTPLLSHVQKGILSINDIVMIETVRKVMKGGDLFFLQIEKFNVITDCEVSQPNEYSYIEIPNYIGKHVPCGAKIGSYYLDILSLTEALPNNINVTLKKVELSVVHQNRSRLASLQTLEENWHNLKLNPDVLGRVISKSQVCFILNISYLKL